MAANALEIGVNIPDIKRVVNFGVPEKINF